MVYADSHVEYIHHPDDDKDLENLDFVKSQIDVDQINNIKPELLFLACFVEDKPEAYSRLLWIINRYRQDIKNNNWILALSKKDLDKKGIKIILHIEDLSSIGKNIDKIDQLYSLGIRSIGLTHNKTNQFAGGALDESQPLTRLGKKAISAILAKNILLDSAHLSKQSFIEILEKYTVTPFISHAGVAGVYNIKRNVDDEILQIVNDKNGYIGIGCAGSFLAKENGSSADYIKQIEYARSIAGDNNVGIGSDMGGVISYLPKGLENIKGLSAFTNIKFDTGTNGQNLINFIKRIWK